jgi:poly(A)-specific ribonuclease
LTTLGKSTFVQVVRTDPVAEGLKREERKARFHRDLQKAIGLRHVVEAIFESRKPLVGHNLFTDLINLYDCFIGPLPNTAREFGVIIHEIFPM